MYPRTDRRAVQWRPVIAAVAGGATASILFLAYAAAGFALLGTPPAQVLQTVASGLIGARAFGLGATAVAMGMGIHVALCMLFAATYVALALVIPRLGQRWVFSGMSYGAIIYFVMQFAVHLSEIEPKPAFPAPMLIVELLAHAFFVGMPIVLANEIARRRDGQGSRIVSR